MKEVYGAPRLGLATSSFAAFTRADSEENTRREIPDLCALMYHFVLYINTLLTRRSRLNSPFKKRTHCHCHLFMALNRAGNMSAADWLIRFFSVVEILMKQSNLYHERLSFMSA